MWQIKFKQLNSVPEAQNHQKEGCSRISHPCGSQVPHSRCVKIPMPQLHPQPHYIFLANQMLSHPSYYLIQRAHTMSFKKMENIKEIFSLIQADRYTKRKVYHEGYLLGFLLKENHRLRVNCYPRNRTQIERLCSCDVKL